jgi:outer membrane protein OmpA-like peptidoglycan-associated protein
MSTAWSAAAGQQPAAAAPASRTTTAVAYQAGRTTKIDLAGTPLLPRTRGEAEIKTTESGSVRIAATIHELAPPTQFGPEYLTFVLWAIPAQGRARNLGELRVDGDNADIETTFGASTFALIVTAEPYYAVAAPGEVVVMENAVRGDTRDRISVQTVRYEMTPRAAYMAPGGVRHLLPPPNRREPPDVQQARNAVAIAQAAEASRLAPSGLTTAERLLAEAERLAAGKASRDEIVSQARAAVHAAEEARQQAVIRRIADEEEAARAAAAAREQAAQAAAAREAALKRAADEERERAERLAQDAAEERQRAEDARREAERARAEAQAQVVRAEALRVKAEQDRATLRATLLRQFNEILETRDTTRGLVVNVGDVLFETGRFALVPPAREKLARFAGLVLAHPGLTIQAEGFTDSTGSAAVNQKLSQQRASTVGEYLIAQGLASDRVTTRGYGAEQPVGSNDTREGRRQNRRVELVVAGDVIGTPLGASR